MIVRTSLLLTALQLVSLILLLLKFERFLKMVMQW